MFYFTHINKTCKQKTWYHLPIIYGALNTVTTADVNMVRPLKTTVRLKHWA